MRELFIFLHMRIKCLVPLYKYDMPEIDVTKISVNRVILSF